MSHRDPWRFVCPECGSHRVERRPSFDSTCLNGESAPGRFNCRACRTHTDRVRDKKTGALVTSVVQRTRD